MRINLKNIQKAFFWYNSSPKTKHKLFAAPIKLDGQKILIFQTKALQFQYSCIRPLYDNFSHEWKLIPLYLIQKSFGTSFKFHSNLLFKSNKTKFFPFFSREIVLNWKKPIWLWSLKYILSQYFWYNGSIQEDNAAAYFSKFSNKYTNYISQRFSGNGSIKDWHEFRR